MGAPQHEMSSAAPARLTESGARGYNDATGSRCVDVKNAVTATMPIAASMRFLISSNSLPFQVESGPNVKAATVSIRSTASMAHGSQRLRVQAQMKSGT